MDRRSALQVLTAGMAIPLLKFPLLTGSAAGQKPSSRRRTSVGLVMYSCRLRRQQLMQEEAGSDLFEPFRFLEHCHALGAGGMQVSLGVLDAPQAAELRSQAEAKGLFIEAIVDLPQRREDLERFDAEMKTAAATGATAARTVMMPGRRYEFFDSLEKYREYDARSRASLEWAAPLAEKHRIPLAVENHKDHRNAERIALFRHIASEYVGACVDLGNSLALLEDPIETVQLLSPWVRAVHLKDQAVQAYKDGFLLADVVLGRGFLDLQKMIEILRTERKNVRFSLELITRDPLRVPCLAEDYWATFPDVPGRDLARTLRAVQSGAADALPLVSSQPLDRQVAMEEANLRGSLHYAREQLGL